MFKKAGIIGLGLIGGSLAKALRSRCGVPQIVACNRSTDVLEQALVEGVIDAFSTEVDEIFQDCDIVILCTPVCKLFEYAQKVSHYVDKNCIITDVGSTKGSIAKNMDTLSGCISYIGGHPMTGSEKFRYQASKEHLFENAYYALTPAQNVSFALIEKMKAMVEAIGAIAIVLSPKAHDYATASISHVPHIVACALVNNVKGLDDPEKTMHQLAAGGFRDTTRIASSSPEMWENICLDNQQEILNVLHHLEDVIKNIKTAIQEKDSSTIFQFFDSARAYRDTFATVTPASYTNRYEIAVDVLDKPGSIAAIAEIFSNHHINIKNMGILNSRETDEGVLYFAFHKEEERKKSVELLRHLHYAVTEK